MARLIQMWINRDERVSYDGLDLKEDLQKAYEYGRSTCTAVYRNSGGKNVTLHFDDVVKRLFKLSFDPYHCIERRWGATSDEELATCPDPSSKTRWYEAEQRLRNQVDRTYDARMDFTVSDLERKVVGSGADTPPDIDVKAVIDNMGYRIPYTPMQPPGY
jgi:hypothetical protein